jgi:hypothetical protein
MPASLSIRCLADLTVPTKEVLDRLEQEWSPESPPAIVAAGAVARAFCSSLTALTPSEIASVGECVEMLLTTGDEDTKDAVATGFLEALLSQASRGGIDLQKVVWMLGPESTKYCIAWDKFSGVKTAGLYVKPC